MYSQISLQQARNDLQYIYNTYGTAHDFCGSFCNTEVLENLLFGKTSIKETIISLIEYYFTNGIDNNSCHSCHSNMKPNPNDPRTKRIMNRYNITIR